MSNYSFSPAGSGDPVESYDGGTGLARVREVALSGLQADWRSLRFVTLTPDSSMGPRELFDSEAIVYVTSGTPTAIEADGNRVPLRPGMNVALVVGTRLHIVNDGGDEANLIIAELGAH